MTRNRRLYFGFNVRKQEFPNKLNEWYEVWLGFYRICYRNEESRDTLPTLPYAIHAFAVYVYTKLKEVAYGTHYIPFSVGPVQWLHYWYLNTGQIM